MKCIKIPMVDVVFSPQKHRPEIMTIGAYNLKHHLSVDPVNSLIIGIYIYVYVYIYMYIYMIN